MTTKKEIETVCDQLKKAMIDDFEAAEMVDRVVAEKAKTHKLLVSAQEAIRALKVQVA